jgi:hypothetical protein
VDSSTPQLFSAQRKVAAALRILQGDSLEVVARELNVINYRTPAQVRADQRRINCVPDAELPLAA